MSDLTSTCRFSSAIHFNLYLTCEEITVRSVSLLLCLQSRSKVVPIVFSEQIVTYSHYECNNFTTIDLILKLR